MKVRFDGSSGKTLGDVGDPLLALPYLGGDK